MGELLTADQQDFEGSGALGWTGFNVTLTRDAVAPLVGTKSLKAVTVADGLAYFGADTISISPGVRTFHVTAQFKGPVGRAMQLWVRRYHPGGGSWTDAVHEFVSTGTVQAIAGKVTTMIDTPSVAVFVLDFNSTLGDPYWLDSVSFTDEQALASYVIELGLTAQPLDALSTVVWTDITEWVKHFQTSRGRSRETEDIRAGTASVVVDNEDGRFDPMNSSGAYYPNLKPMRRLRISAVYQGATYRLFTGYVDDYRIVRSNAFASLVSIKATDAFKLLNLQNLSDPYEHAVRQFTPRAYYRFQEDGNSAVLPLQDASGNGRAAELYNPVQTVEGLREGYELLDAHPNAPGRVLRLWDEALADLPAEYSAYALAPEAGVSGTSAFSISFWFQRALYNSATNGSILSQANQVVFTDTGDQLSIQEGEASDGSLFLRVSVWRSGVTILDYGVVLGWFQGPNFVRSRRGLQGMDHVVVTRDGTTFTVIVNGGYAGDGGFVSAGVASSNPNFASRRIWIGTASGHSYVNGVFYTFPGLLAEVAVFPMVLTEADALTLFSAGQRGANQLPGDRLESLYGQLGWSAIDTNFEPGSSRLADFVAAGESSLSHLLAVAKADDGIFFIAGDGVATFYGRRHLLTAARSTEPQVVFGDADDGTVVPYEPNGLDPAMDESEIYNDVIAQRTDGLPQRASSQSSIETYGQRTMSETGLIVADDNEALARAQFKADLYAEPMPRIRSMTFSERDTLPIATAFPPALGLELWDRIIYRQQLPDSALWEQDSIIEGLSHNYNGDTGELKVTISMSSLPASLSEGGYWILNQSELGTDTVLAY